MDMDYIFDTDLFLARLAESCPQLRLFHSARAIPGPRPVFELPQLKLQKNLTVGYSMERLTKHLRRNQGPEGSIRLLNLIQEYGPLLAEPPYLDK